MRDLLTVLASIIIAVLAAALAVPPFFPWDSHRASIDAALSRAAGIEVAMGGRISIRLLPTPRIEVERLLLGSSQTGEPSLAATDLRAEIALTPLLHGEVRFLETRITRAELRVPTGAEGDWRIPREFLSDPVMRREWAFEDLSIDQLLLTAFVPATGRTDQFFAQGVAIQGQSLAGPWRVEGSSGTVPFQLVTGELAEDRTLLLKLSGGGDQTPRFEADAKLSFLPGPRDTLVPTLAGSAKVLLGPPAQVAATGLPIPVQIQGGFSALGKTIELEAVTVEAGTGGASVRLSGTGSISGDEPRIRFALEGRRVDIDSFILSPSGAALAERATGSTLPLLPVPVAFEIKLDSIGLAQEELTNFVLRAVLADGELRVETAEINGPGQTRLSASGDVRPLQRWATNARLAIASPASDRLARYLGRLGLPARFTNLLDGRPLDAASDITLDPALSSFRNLSVKLGSSTLTGAGRYTPPDRETRGRFDAQLALQGLDLNALPQLGGVFDAIQSLDLGLILDARGLGYGGIEGGGRILARVASDGPALLVERLEIVDLAGANANVSGRIAPDGSGRIEGRLTAPRAAPLIDLLGQAWLGGLATLAPAFLRDGNLDLTVSGERAFDPRNAAPGLKTVLRGTASGGPLEADVFAQNGTVQTLALTLATDRTGVWLGNPDAPALRMPGRMELRGTRLPSGQMTLQGSADIVGVKVATGRPLMLGRNDDLVEGGDVAVTARDINPLLTLLDEGAIADKPSAADLQVMLGRDRDGPQITATGRLGGETLEGRFVWRSRSEVGGSLTVSRLSLPWLASVFALNAPATPTTGAIWPTTRFGALKRGPLAGQVTVSARQLDLGRGLVGDTAVLSAAVSPEGITLRDVAFGFGGGRVSGSLAVQRQGSLASLIGEGSFKDVPLASLAGPDTVGGRLSGTLRIGGSGETASALVANLGGSGTIQLADLKIVAADAGAVDRATTRALRDPDPLAPRRLEAILSEELARGPLAGSAPPAQATMVGGALRVGPLGIAAPQGTWEGTLVFDLKTLRLDARGTLNSTAPPPRGWAGSPPYIVLNWQGPLSGLKRDLDVTPLTNGLASIVLQRELDKVESFEADVNERARLNSRRDMEQARRAAEEAARLQRVREQQAEAERLRLAEEAARREREQPNVFQPSPLQPSPLQPSPLQPSLAPPAQPGRLPSLPMPLEIRPAPQIRSQPSGG